MNELASEEQFPAGMRSIEEERVNCWTHGIGLAISLIAGGWMLTTQADSMDFAPYWSCVLYVSTLILVYLASTLSHVVFSKELRNAFRSLDQGSIYLFIVGTYTPFSVTYLQSLAWWWILGGMWLLAIAGFASKVFFTHRVDSVSIWLYLILGWIPLASLPWLLFLVPIPALLWVLAGGICYSVGTIFLVWDGRVRHFHAVWHLLVMAGTAIHFLAILFFVVDKS